MSSLFEKCAYCGNAASGSLFCSDPCRFAASLNQDSEAAESTNTDQHSSVDTDPVMDSLEIVGFLVAEPKIHATEVSTRGQRELAQYEDFFDIKRGNKKKKIKQDSMCDATHGGGTSTSDSTNRPDMTRKYDKSC
jgi:hypothetical protein